VGVCSEELVGRVVAILVFCPEAEDLLQIDYGPTARHIYIVLTETTTTSCANLVYTHNSNMPTTDCMTYILLY